jgi:hypothetical protein
MSQFDFPRINFHGTAILDTPTANNGNYETGLVMFDQDESEPFLPPLCYLPAKYTYNPPAGVTILHDANGNAYVQLTAVNDSNYQQWATTPLGSFEDDAIYHSLYDFLQLTGSNPGYWNYYGDLSVTLQNTKVTGITVLDSNNTPITYKPNQLAACPAALAPLLDAELSFNNNYFDPASRTTAYFCDVDSIGQMCTQLFCGQAGLYTKDANGNPVTFFSGTPVKSTARWMNLTKVLNYADRSLIPMAGSACFYSMIPMDSDSDFAKTMYQQTGKQAAGLFLKLLIHEVHEVRQPDYSQLKGKIVYDLNGYQSLVPKNPAMASVSGSITPWYPGDMKTTSISRLMKNSVPLAIDSTNIPKPETYNGTKLTVPGSVNLGAIQFIHNKDSNLISLDLINCINEYGTGTNPNNKPPYAGPGDIPPFQSFESYNFGEFTLMFQPDSPGSPQIVGIFNFDNNYNMSQLLAHGGMVDLKVPTGINYSGGYFYLELTGNTVSTETNYHITSDQMGNYAQQNQGDNNYMSDGLPRIPFTLSVFYRGNPVLPANAAAVTKQAINLRTGFIQNTPGYTVYNGMTIAFPININGCITYAFVDAQSQIWDGTMPKLFQFAMNTSMVVVRTLESDALLEQYLDGSTPISWDVVYNNIFKLFKVLYPVMNAILPFTEANWSDPFLLRKLLMLTDESNWNKPLYMPVTRDLSAQQQKLLTMWANQILNAQ